MREGRTFMVRKAILFGVFVTFLFCFCTSDLRAGGGHAYPNGAEGFMVAMMPPPGLTLVNYAYYGHAGKLKDDNGDDTHLLDDADIGGDIIRLIWISKYRLFGASYGQHFFFGAINKDMDFNAPVGSGMKKHYSDFNALYVIYSPLLLGWHLDQGRLHVAVSASDIYFPLYNEDKGNMASVGRNFWTFEPVLAVTYFPLPQLETSIKFMYDFNTHQDDYEPGPPVRVDRTPGQEFHFDFNVSWGLTDYFRFGINGYFYQQTTSDDFDDLGGLPSPLKKALKDIEDDKSRAVALGPGFMYQHKNFMATLRYQHEFAVKNGPEKQNVWFKLIYIF